MDTGDEQLRWIWIVGKTHAQRLNAHAVAAAGRRFTTVQEPHRRLIDPFRELMRRWSVDRGRTNLSLRIIRRNQLRRSGVAVHDVHHDFAEAPADMGRNRLQSVDVRDGTTPDFFTGHWVMIGGPGWLGDKRRE